MRILSSILICLILLCSACSYRPAPENKNKITFVRFYTDYGQITYSRDSVKLPRPLPILIGMYFIEYELRPSSIIMRKRELGDNGAQTVLLTQTLSKTDSRLVARHLATAQPAQLAQRCAKGGYMIDDGFYLDITLLQAGRSTEFRRYGHNEPMLFDLLAVANKLAPQKYQFYEPDQRAAFEQLLMRNSRTF